MLLQQLVINQDLLKISQEQQPAEQTQKPQLPNFTIDEVVNNLVKVAQEAEANNLGEKEVAMSMAKVLRSYNDKLAPFKSQLRDKVLISMISHHADNLIKLAKKLDRLGKFNLSDKIDGFIKTSGGIVPQAFDYKPTEVDFGGSLIGNFVDPNSLKDSSLGYRIKGEQYAPGSAYVSEFGPNLPFVVPDELMLTPQKYAQLVNAGKFEEIARIQSELGLLSLNYLKSSGANIHDLKSLTEMWDNSPSSNKK